VSVAGAVLLIAAGIVAILRLDRIRRARLVSGGSLVAGMQGAMYQRPPYPSTWARMHGKGRVYYTALGHREDVWTNAIFQQIILGGMSWALGQVNADITPNITHLMPR